MGFRHNNYFKNSAQKKEGESKIKTSSTRSRVNRANNKRECCDACNNESAKCSNYFTYLVTSFSLITFINSKNTQGEEEINPLLNSNSKSESELELELV